MKRFLSFLLLWCLCGEIAAQSVDSTIQFSGYAEAYYAYDFALPSNHQRPDFLYNHSRSQELGLNLAYIKASLSRKQYRMNVALMAGTYAQYNLATEPVALRHVYEANAGFSLGEKWWIDAGVFSSHIGWETAKGADNPTLTRSLAAENSPYYESGIKCTYTPNDKWTLTGMYLNGWQRMQRANGSFIPAFGVQVTYKKGDTFLFNYSNFIGSSGVAPSDLFRHFHDVYVTASITQRLGFTAGFDAGAEQRSVVDRIMAPWVTFAVIPWFRISDRWQMALRAEAFWDKEGKIIASNFGNETYISGGSFNVDYLPAKNVKVRAEYRMLYRQDGFISGGTLRNDNQCITVALMAGF